MAAARKNARPAHEVSVRVKPPHTRRWRAGMCFTRQPRVESVSDAVLARMQADALLIVEIVKPAPATEG